MPLRRIAVLASGGDAPGMNAALRAVVRIAAYNGLEVIGVRGGYQGLLDGDMAPLGPRDVSNVIQNGGVFLGTGRSPQFATLEGRRLAATNLDAAGVDGLVVVGGDGSFRGAAELGRVWVGAVVGVPGTIDNDIYGTDRTIGFDTAVNTATECIDKIRDTAAAHRRIFVVEVMGRHAGFIAKAVGMAGGAEEILIPETPTDFGALAERLRANIQRGKKSNLVVVAEGDEGGGAESVRAHLAGVGIETRTVILGHLQRGGRPSAADRILATRLGAAAVEALLDGKNGVMAGLTGGKVAFTSFEEATGTKAPLDTSLVELAIKLST